MRNVSTNIYFRSVVLSLILLMLFAISVEAKEDGGISQHDMFEFEAFIKHDDIIYGTAPFDKDDSPGNDSGPKNGIVRSFDTFAYPLKVTINPKKADSLKNIKLRISGTLENGIVDNRVNANFAIGGKEDISENEVSFIQDYTIESTGNSIMIPITVEVQGAKPDVKLTPKISVEVVSVDGKVIKGVKRDFNNLPGARVSAKVNIKPYMGGGLAGRGIQVLPYSNITKDEGDLENTHATAISWGVDRLPGKTDMRGATFPDPRGDINFEIVLSSYTDWDKDGRQHHDYKKIDTPFHIFDHQPINSDQNKIGRENMVAEGKSYKYSYALNYSAPRSDLPDLTQSSIDKYGHHRVWDSGDWFLSKPKVEKDKVIYSGSNTDFIIGSTFPRYRADGYVGSSLYGVNDKVFSTHSFILLAPNEYRIGGPNNKSGKANNAYYRTEVRLLDYTDEKGNKTIFNKTAASSFYERNNPSGSFSLNTTLFSYPGGKELGTPNVGDSSVCKGDVSTLIGGDVQIVGYLYPKMVSYGGHQKIYRWNTDAFELTKDYAEIAHRNLLNSTYYTPSLTAVKGNKKTQIIHFGVAKFSDNSFKNFTSKHMEDYDWYETYDEAVKKGPIGAMRLDIKAPTGGRTQTSGRVPLKVKHEDIGIGAKNKHGTDNIMVINYYAYLDEARTKKVVVGGTAYNRPAIWDENGTIIEKQSPAGGSINFETLAVTPAETSLKIDSDKTSYYNSETIKWTTKNSIVLPASGVPDDLDAGVIVRHTLPKGLNYKTGTGMIGKEKREPEIFIEGDKTELVWRLMVSNSTHKIEDIYFETTINPFALSSGVQSSVELKAVIESELDRRRENLRTGTKSVTVLKVGMVGIYETINKNHGDKNSDYIVTLSPYTTVEDENRVVGLTHLPQNGKIGSDFSGDVRLKEIKTSVEREHDDEVKIYLNKNRIEDDKPNKIDVNKNGWYEYTGKSNELVNAKSMLFVVEGLMTNKDNIGIDIKVQTENNNFGDIYLNESIINSATDYKLSPLSNRVRYTIRPDLELALERFQIFTNKYDEGLPTSIRVRQTVLDEARIKDKDITLSIYEGDKKVASKTYKQKELKNENEILIPKEFLKKADKKNYEARIEGFDENRIWIKDGEGSIDTDGYTSKEVTITEGNTTFKDVVMTERELGRDIVKYYETIKIPKPKRPKVISGYGFDIDTNIEYTNEVMGAVQNKIPVRFSTDADYNVDYRLMDNTLDYDKDEGMVSIRAYMEEDTSTNKIVSKYKFPKIYIEQGTGYTYTENQKDSIVNDYCDAGNKLYVPIWIDSTGYYSYKITSEKPIGSHRVHFDLEDKVNVYAYMFNHLDSDSFKEDSILIHPKALKRK